MLETNNNDYPEEYNTSNFGELKKHEFINKEENNYIYFSNSHKIIENSNFNERNNPELLYHYNKQSSRVGLSTLSSIMNNEDRSDINKSVLSEFINNECDNSQTNIKNNLIEHKQKMNSRMGLKINNNKSDADNLLGGIKIIYKVIKRKLIFIHLLFLSKLKIYISFSYHNLNSTSAKARNGIGNTSNGNQLQLLEYKSIQKNEKTNNVVNDTTLHLSNKLIEHMTSNNIENINKKMNKRSDKIRLFIINSVSVIAIFVFLNSKSVHEKNDSYNLYYNKKYFHTEVGQLKLKYASFFDFISHYRISINILKLKYYSIAKLSQTTYTKSMLFFQLNKKTFYIINKLVKLFAIAKRNCILTVFNRIIRYPLRLEKYLLLHDGVSSNLVSKLNLNRFFELTYKESCYLKFLFNMIIILEYIWEKCNKSRIREAFNIIKYRYHSELNYLFFEGKRKYLLTQSDNNNPLINNNFIAKNKINYDILSCYDNDDQSNHNATNLLVKENDNASYRIFKSYSKQNGNNNLVKKYTYHPSLRSLNAMNIIKEDSYNKIQAIDSNPSTRIVSSKSLRFFLNNFNLNEDDEQYKKIDNSDEEINNILNNKIILNNIINNNQLMSEEIKDNNNKDKIEINSMSISLNKVSNDDSRINISSNSINNAINQYTKDDSKLIKEMNKLKIEDTGDDDENDIDHNESNIGVDDEYKARNNLNDAYDENNENDKDVYVEKDNINNNDNKIDISINSIEEEDSDNENNSEYSKSNDNKKQIKEEVDKAFKSINNKDYYNKDSLYIFTTIIESLLIKKNLIKNNVINLINIHSKRTKLIEKHPRIDHLIIENSAIVNWEIEKRLVPKSKENKMLQFYYKLYKPYFKLQVNFYRKFLINCFETWRGIVIDEKFQVLKELQKIEEEIDLYSEKIVNYENTTEDIEDKIKTITLKAYQCTKCRGFVNPDYTDFNATSSILKEETYHQINIIPQFKVHGFIQDKKEIEKENKQKDNNNNKDLRKDFIISKQNSNYNGKSMKSNNNNNKLSQGTKKMSSNFQDDDCDVGDNEIVDLNEITKNLDLAKLSKCFIFKLCVTNI